MSSLICFDIFKMYDRFSRLQSKFEGSKYAQIKYNSYHVHTGFTSSKG